VDDVFFGDSHGTSVVRVCGAVWWVLDLWMRSGRSGKPLFEHLSKGEEEPADFLGAGGGEMPDRVRGGVRLSLVALYGLIAGSIVVAVACWSIGYRIGYGAGEASWLEENPGAVREFPVDPLGGGGAVDGAGADAGGDGGVEVAGALEGAEGRAGVLSVRGELDRDPRQDGYNYLELATLSLKQAESAMGFLADRGVHSIAVPVVENGGGGANNPVRYRLVSIEVAIPGEQFRAMRVARLDHERLIERLGSEWRREYNGVSDFARPLWKRYP
jgi:hypothetical protein